MSKRLYDALKDCKKEEEVKASFCSFFKMKINALKAIDLYTPTVLFEFKYDRNFKSVANIAHVIAQTMYYARLLKFNLTKYPLPPYICVVDKNEAFFVETKPYSKFYSSTAAKYDWDRAASTPCPNLVADIVAAVSSKPPYHADGRAASMTPPLSSEAQAVMDAARSLYRKFYAEIANTNWMDAKIETWDVGYYQICKALKEVGLATDEFAALKVAHDALRAKLLPKVYEYGFLNPDVEVFK